MIGSRVLWHVGAWLALAAAVHLAAVWTLPRAIMDRVLKGVQEEGGGAPVLPPMTSHEQRRIVMPSPDLLYAMCGYDLARGPLRVRADPRWPNYWSIALYASNSDNFFVVNDGAADGQAIDLVLTAPGQAASAALPPGARVVPSPTTRGVLLMRLLVGDDAAERERLEAARRTLRCEPLASP